MIPPMPPVTHAPAAPLPEPAPSSSLMAHLGIGGRITLLALGATLVATLLIAYLGYRALIVVGLRGNDAKLAAVAVALPEILPDHYHQRLSDGTLTQAEFEAASTRLDAYAHQAGVQYIYSYIEKDGKLLSASTSATAEDRAEGFLPTMLDPYKSPPPEIWDAERRGVTTFASYTDEFGSFRSAFVPMTDGATRYVVGVDVKLGQIAAAARVALLRTVGVALLVTAVVGAGAVYFGQRISGPIKELSRHIHTFADEDFTNDAHTEAALGRLARTDTTETGALAQTLLFQNRRLHEYLARFEQATREKQHIASQLQIAREVQLSLLPKSPPAAAGYDIAGWSEAADEAGGDFYDFLPSGTGPVILTVADVSGHGIGPAIMASVCHAYARATLTTTSPLQPLIDRLNNLMAADMSEGRFVTYFSSVLDPAKHVLSFVSAGHGPVLIFRAATGDVEEAPTHGLPLGIVPDFQFERDSSTPIHPGDVILMASDGFWEYGNTRKELFGVQRLKNSLKAAAGEPAATIIERIRADVAAFTAGVPQPDDMTAVVVKRLA